LKVARNLKKVTSPISIAWSRHQCPKPPLPDRRVIGAATVEDAADGRGVVEAVDALAGVVMVVAEGMAVVVTAEGDARALQIRTNINWEAANRIAAFLFASTTHAHYFGK